MTEASLFRTEQEAWSFKISKDGMNSLREQLLASYAARIALQEAARDVLAWRIGELPTAGWLRDNDASRAALEKLNRAYLTLSPEQS